MAVFEIQDGRKFLYQWDLNRNLKVNDANIKEAHFCYSDGGPVYSVQVTGTSVRTAEIPQEILQQYGTFKVYGYKYGDEQYTKVLEYFDVISRPQPTNYTPSIKGWFIPEEKILEIETKVDGNISDINEIRANVTTNSEDIAAQDIKIENISSQVQETNDRIDTNNKRLDNLEHILDPDCFQSDSEVKSIKYVPEGVCPYVQINQVGGMSCKSNNLLCYPYAETNKTSAGITFTANSDGSITINGTNDGTNNSVFHISKLDQNAIHLTAGQYTASTGNAGVVCIINKGTSYLWGTFTIDNKDGYAAYIQIAKGDTTTYSNVKIYPMLNEGSTALSYELGFEGIRDNKIIEIKSYGKNLYYGEQNLVLDGTQKKGLVLWEDNINEPVTFSFKTNLEYRNPNGASTIRLTKADGSVVSVTSYVYKYTVPSLTKIQLVNWAQDIGTYYDIQLEYGSTATDYAPYKKFEPFEIPEELRQFLEQYGYGKGVNATDYNYIDFENKQFVKCIDGVDMGTLTWTRTDTGRFTALLPKASKDMAYGVGGGICDKYAVRYENAEKVCYITLLTLGGIGVVVTDSEYTDVETFKNAVSGVMLYYALAIPEEIDISEYLTRDNFIQVEDGSGKIFLIDENNYNYDVPNTITYLKKEANQ